MGTLNHRTLLLDATYRPIRVISWMRAVVLDFQNKVMVVETYDECARSQNGEWPLPAVVALKRFHGYRPFKVRFTKRNVFLRDAHVCQYCGERFITGELTIDHVVPRAHGGRSTWENVVAACEPCNHGKGNRTPREAGMRLLRAPVRPTPQVNGHVVLQAMPPEWETYLETQAQA